LRVYRDKLLRREDPSQLPYYWIGGESPTGVIAEGTDFEAISAGYVSITPLHLDLTAYNLIETLNKYNWD
jgi:5'-nucleotidase